MRHPICFFCGDTARARAGSMFCTDKCAARFGEVCAAENENYYCHKMKGWWFKRDGNCTGCGARIADDGKHIFSRDWSDIGSEPVHQDHNERVERFIRERFGPVERDEE